MVETCNATRLDNHVSMPQQQSGDCKCADCLRMAQEMAKAPVLQLLFHNRNTTDQQVQHLVDSDHGINWVANSRLS